MESQSFGEPSDREIQILALADHLRDTIARRRLLLPEERRVDAAVEPVAAAIQRASAKATVNPHLPIAWPTWPPGLLPKAIAVAQKLTRRLLAWYINPIVAQQNTFNGDLVRVAQELRQANADLTTRVAELERAIAELRERSGTSAARP